MESSNRLLRPTAATTKARADSIRHPPPPPVTSSSTPRLSSSTSIVRDPFGNNTTTVVPRVSIAARGKTYTSADDNTGQSQRSALTDTSSQSSMNSLFSTQSAPILGLRQPKHGDAGVFGCLSSGTGLRSVLGELRAKVWPTEHALLKPSNVKAMNSSVSRQSTAILERHSFVLNEFKQRLGTLNSEEGSLNDASNMNVFAAMALRKTLPKRNESQGEIKLVASAPATPTVSLSASAFKAASGPDVMIPNPPTTSPIVAASTVPFGNP